MVRDNYKSFKAAVVITQIDIGDFYQSYSKTYVKIVNKIPSCIPRHLGARTHLITLRLLPSESGPKHL
jgi:hypothetical protein